MEFNVLLDMLLYWWEGGWEGGSGPGAMVLGEEMEEMEM